MKEPLIKEAKRLQELAGIKEIKILNLVVPEGWVENKIVPEQDPEEDIEIKSWSAPMEGWDSNHTDTVIILKTPPINPMSNKPQDVYYYVRTYIAFGERDDSNIKHKNYRDALKEAIEIMNKIKENWVIDDEY